MNKEIVQQAYNSLKLEEKDRMSKLANRLLERVGREGEKDFHFIDALVVLASIGVLMVGEGIIAG